MKNRLGILLFALFFRSACDKDKNRRAGVCYGEFASGDKQAYDLSHLPR